MVLITLSGATNTSQQSCFKSNKIRENLTDDIKESSMIYIALGKVFFNSNIFHKSENHNKDTPGKIYHQET